MSHRSDHSLVPLGQYRGQKWTDVPSSYLYYIGNQLKDGKPTFLGMLCRREVVRRRTQIGSDPADPWAEVIPTKE